MDLPNADEDYAALSDRMDKLKTQYPVIDKVNEDSGEIRMTADAFGGRLQVDRQSVDPNKLRFGRFFFDGDGFQTVQEVGIVRPGESFHFRYMASVQTPGSWVQPGTDVDFEAKWEANARWARLVALGSPVGSA